jgi:SOS-response transcriptional repressor LexA
MRQKFKEVLRKRLDELGWTYEDLARRVGVVGVYVSRIVQGRQVPSDEVIYKLASALDLELERLILLARYEKAPEPVKPVYERLARRRAAEHLGDVSGFDNIEMAALGHGREIPQVGMVQAGEFAASEDGDSMEPDFRERDVLIVNPNLEAQNGDYVIAKLTDDNEATFKKLVIHDNLIILRPLNARYEDMVITDTSRVQIVGKVVERKTLL